MSDLTLQKHIVMMKSGLMLHVSPETAERISNHLVNQTGHSFLRIAELGQTINTAEVEGVYTPEKHEEMLRLKGGEYQCSFGKWHKKREQCECVAEARKERERVVEERRRQEENRTLTPEEREKAREFLEKYRPTLKA